MPEPITVRETVMVNGHTIGAEALAAARQQLAHEGAFLPSWDDLTPDERRQSTLEAAGWLRALSRLGGDGGVTHG